MVHEQILKDIDELIMTNRVVRQNMNMTEFEKDAFRRNNDILSKARHIIKNGFAGEYERGLNDAWELTRKIGCSIPNGGYTITELKMIFGSMDMCDVFNDNSTCQEALAKVEEYEKKKAEEESKKLVAGDVVTYFSNMSKTAIFLYESFKDYWILIEAGECPQSLSKDRFTLKKTGKHVDLEGLFAGIKEE